jgi:hypothetical protein
MISDLCMCFLCHLYSSNLSSDSVVVEYWNCDIKVMTSEQARVLQNNFIKIIQKSLIYLLDSNFKGYFMGEKCSVSY